MLFIATGLHLLLILGVSFEFEVRDKQASRQQNLEVILVEHPKEPPEPEDPVDFLAQTSQAGGGDRNPVSRPTNQPVMAAEPPAPPPAPQEKATPVLPAPSQQVVTKAESKQKIMTAGERPTREAPVKPSATQLFASRDQEIAHLTAVLQKKTLAYSNLPKRKAISASTKEYKYAAYLDAWRRKVERIGNLNYPDEAKRQKLYGNMILHVAVRSDGSVEQVRVMRSSGHQILDDAAVRIVRLAAPFSPFPQEINQETDILDITRTWQFTRSNRLGTE
ncbi:MAG: energy transducer TonB [Gammaproteobacteria bacterium]|nr:energy transducer TonB [Gammaproteobacteria bacterium]